MRKLARGVPGAVLAALSLVVRLLAASVTMAAPVPNATIDLISELSVFCHAGTADTGGTEKAPASDHECLACPACHLTAHAGLPTPMPAAVPTRVDGMVVLAARPAPATEPPRQPRSAAHPTGPPTAAL